MALVWFSFASALHLDVILNNNSKSNRKLRQHQVSVCKHALQRNITHECSPTLIIGDDFVMNGVYYIKKSNIMSNELKNMQSIMKFIMTHQLHFSCLDTSYYMNGRVVTESLFRKKIVNIKGKTS